VVGSQTLRVKTYCATRKAEDVREGLCRLAIVGSSSKAHAY
jgi:hypothetical protein